MCSVVSHISLRFYWFFLILFLSLWFSDHFISINLSLNLLFLLPAHNYWWKTVILFFHFNYCTLHLKNFYLILRYNFNLFSDILDLMKMSLWLPSLSLVFFVFSEYIYTIYLSHCLLVPQPFQKASFACFSSCVSDSFFFTYLIIHCWKLNILDSILLQFYWVVEPELTSRACCCLLLFRHLAALL